MNDRLVDQMLVERAQKGNLKAFEMLVIKYQWRLIRLLSRMIKDEHEAEDVAQETFIRAYRSLGNFRFESAFYTWLYKIGINTANTYLSSQNRKITTVSDTSEDGVEEIDILADENTPETIMINKQLIENLDLFVKNLSEESRMAFLLREVDGLSYEEIAQIMDCPIGTVRSRIFRAREEIAKQLDQNN